MAATCSSRWNLNASKPWQHRGLSIRSSPFWCERDHSVIASTRNNESNPAFCLPSENAPPSALGYSPDRGHATATAEDRNLAAPQRDGSLRLRNGTPLGKRERNRPRAKREGPLTALAHLSTGREYSCRVNAGDAGAPTPTATHASTAERPQEDQLPRRRSYFDRNYNFCIWRHCEPHSK